MYHIVYLSSARALFTQEELHELLEISRRNNSQRGVTGILFYKDGNFLQAIEGEEHDVKAIYAKICRDERHAGVIPVFQEPIPAREFADWSMAFRNFDNMEAPEGFNDILNQAPGKMDLSTYSSKIRAFLQNFAR